VPRIISFEEYVKLPNQPSLRYQLPIGLRRQVREMANGCWLWTGHINREGYGRARFLGKEHAAHRLVWRLLNGELRRTQDLHHTCGTLACVQPAHLWPIAPRKHTRLHARARRRPSKPSSATPSAVAA
jgi:hypothetical protein